MKSIWGISSLPSRSTLNLCYLLLPVWVPPMGAPWPGRESGRRGERGIGAPLPCSLPARSGPVHSPLSYPSMRWSLCCHSVAQSCPTLCDPRNHSTPGLPVHHQLPESTQTHVHRVGDAIQPSHPLSSPSPPALSLSQHQGLFK